MQLGAHESIQGGLDLALRRGLEATCDTIQLFNKSSNQWQAKPLTVDAVDRFRRARVETGVGVACSHTSYLINLASPDLAVEQKSLHALIQELSRCQRLEIPALVLHPGSHMGSGEKAGAARVARNVNRALAALPDDQVMICLETTAGQGNQLGYTFEQLAEILELIQDNSRAGVCLDTAHVFAAGYPLASMRDYRATRQAFIESIGLDRLQVIHLNDSRAPLSSRRDRHEHIGEGEIGLDAFAHIVNDPCLQAVPMILETEKEEDLVADVLNLALLRSLVETENSA